MAYSLTITLPGLPESPNKLMHKKWQAQLRHKKMWREAVWLACYQYLPEEPLKRARVTMTRHSSAHSMDTDNLAASFKCLLDALKYQPKVNPNFRGVIFDDSPEFIEARYFFEKAPMREGHVTILIEDIG